MYPNDDPEQNVPIVANRQKAEDITEFIMGIVIDGVPIDADLDEAHILFTLTNPTADIYMAAKAATIPLEFKDMIADAYGSATSQNSHWEFVKDYIKLDEINSMFLTLYCDTNPSDLPFDSSIYL